ncbi:ABC transporter ATP-binding protein [uncultured Clostridium sp.]|uniref:ABC transporter ATP-binding protein n=1 Tax=uncultured Clostridium sp. TaxID=59620 RepID=UPI00258F98FF|nr:polyamine ABC transporter ATP-binding protein [uncultured Clostridium sp.]MDU1349690.1 polyamine ABC transporter ATP-binding protein [Clostridium argentinense]
MIDVMVQLKGVSKRFVGSDSLAVKDVSLDIKRGEFLTILGPSGCGKTTTLRMIAGFEDPSIGSIYIDKEDVSKIPAYKRCVNTVFQSYALFPHMNIFENVAFGLKVKNVSESQIKTRVNEMLKMVQLEGYEHRMPNELSGGQKQRVAIARAVINNPKVLLLDEPLGALDLKLRKQMQLELKQLQRKLGITFIYVTHDQEEALTMSDRIVVMNKGVIEHVGTPAEIYEKPRTKFVANFIGETNLFEGTILEKGEYRYLINKDDGEEILITDSPISMAQEICLAVRPERIKLSNNVDSGMVGIKVSVKERIYNGSVIKTVVVTKNGMEFVVSEPISDVYSLDADNKPYVFATWNPKHAVVVQ